MTPKFKVGQIVIAKSGINGFNFTYKILIKGINNKCYLAQYREKKNGKWSEIACGGKLGLFSFYCYATFMFY